MFKHECQFVLVGYKRKSHQAILALFIAQGTVNSAILLVWAMVRSARSTAVKAVLENSTGIVPKATALVRECACYFS